MSNQTLTWGIKYPDGSVAPNVPLDMQTLAESTDSALTSSQKLQQMTLSNGGFAWNANAAWDAGALTVDTSANASSQMTSPQPSFAAQGSLSGAIKFTQTGIYEIRWYVKPSADPGKSGYTITTSGTWPTVGGGWDILGRASKPTSDYYWETVVTATNVVIPQANLEIRLTGQQTNASTNVALVKIVKVGTV